MGWKDWLVVFLVGITAGWMLFDGARALIVGDFVTPQSGEYAGQLGPWSDLVQVIGIEPRSTLMKAVFVVYGIAAFIALAGFVSNQSWGRSALMAVALFGLWYLPIGTATNLVTLILLLTTRR